MSLFGILAIIAIIYITYSVIIYLRYDKDEDSSFSFKDLLIAGWNDITNRRIYVFSNTNNNSYENEEDEEDVYPCFTPEYVITLRNQRKGFTGVYIIFNETKGLCYVGQGQNVYQRCSNHFLGKGNSDIYADYKYGDDFGIEFISLIDSGYDNLDDLERYYINKYDAVRRGYNRKKGNR